MDNFSKQIRAKWIKQFELYLNSWRKMMEMPQNKYIKLYADAPNGQGFGYIYAKKISFTLPD